MGSDRIIPFAKDAARPRYEDIFDALQRYLGGVGSVERDDSISGAADTLRVLMARLPGFPTNTWSVDANISSDAIHGPNRWFEVWVHPKHLNVETRRGDAFTCAVADGFAEECARWWGTEILR
jgi:hypothetical protein